MPLGDLAYAAVDFAAASDGYRDRLAAYRQCFEPGGRFTTVTDRLMTEGSAGLGLDDRLRSLTLQACWLRHAGNEQREGGAERPFLSILRRAAESWLR